MKRKNRRKFWGLSKWLEKRREKIEKKEAEQEEFYRYLIHRMQGAARKQTFFSTKEEDDWLKAYMGAPAQKNPLIKPGTLWMDCGWTGGSGKNIDWNKEMKKLLKGDYDE